MAAVLDHYQVQYGHKHGFQKVRCPVHNDGTPSMTVDVQSGAFKCHACDAHGGDSLQMIRLIEQCSFPEALKIYEQITGVAVKTGSSQPQAAKRVAAGNGFKPAFRRKPQL